MNDRPQPVLNAATVASGITAAVGLLLTLLVVTGVIGSDDSDRISEALTPALTAIVAVISTVAAALRARQKVTPLAAPRNNDGTPLMAVPGLSPGPTA